jgi:quinol monooxygenase YgiN
MNQPPLVITSVFTLHDPSEQRTLFELLSQNATDVLRESPGFLGSTLSRSDDGHTVVHHATWSDQRAVAAMLATPGARAGVRRTKELAIIQVIRAGTDSRFFTATSPE